MIHDFGNMIKRVGEDFPCGPVAVPETGVIREPPQMVTIGKVDQERFEHP